MAEARQPRKTGSRSSSKRPSPQPTPDSDLNSETTPPTNPTVGSPQGTDPNTLNTDDVNRQRNDAQGEMSSEEVARRAYELYLQRGGSHGGDQDDWFRAEQEVRYGSPGLGGRSYGPGPDRRDEENDRNRSGNNYGQNDEERERSEGSLDRDFNYGNEDRDIERSGREEQYTRPESGFSRNRPGDREEE